MAHHRRFMSLVDQYPVPIQQVNAINRIRGINTSFLAQQTTTIPVTTMHPNHSFDAILVKPACSTQANKFDPTSNLIEPQSLGLVPHVEWYSQPMSLKDIQVAYFMKRNGAARQFDFKLYNALRITKMYPNAYNYVGVAWVGENVFKVNAEKICKFFGLNMTESLLFHKQGIFKVHGFEEIPKSSQFEFCDDVDDNHVRLLVDTQKRFSRSTEFISADKIYNSAK